jgi:DNA polymerase III delta prime subunit
MKGIEPYLPFFEPIVNRKKAAQIVLVAPKGSGKSTIALLLLRARFCENRNGFDCCNKCETCKEIGDGYGYGRRLHSSFLKTGTTLDFSLIYNEFAYASFWGGGRFVWLDDADNVHPNDYDRLQYYLDVFSEVPVVLVVTDISKLPPIIETRVRHIPIFYSFESMKEIVTTTCVGENIPIQQQEAVDELVRRAAKIPRTILLSLSSIKDLAESGDKEFSSGLSLRILDHPVISANLMKPTGGSRFTIHDNDDDED